MSKIDEARKIYEKVNGDEAKFLEAVAGMLTPLGAKTYFNTIKSEQYGKKAFRQEAAFREETSTTKRFDVIELDTNITDEFKDQVFSAFSSYYCLSDLKWEVKPINGKEMLVLTSSTLFDASSTSSASLNAMRDGLRWGYKCGLNAPRPKPLTKAQRMDKLYDDVRGSYPKYMKAAMELKLPMEQADSYWDKAVAKRNKSKEA